MNEMLKKIVSEDSDIKKLFVEIYDDLEAEKAYNNLKITKTEKEKIIKVPVEDQILQIAEALLEKRGIYFESNEIYSFAIEYGRHNFNFE